MYQLTSKGIINNNVVMVNMLNDHGNSSIVKFGSWDENALKSGEPLNLFKTKSGAKKDSEIIKNAIIS